MAKSEDATPEPDTLQVGTVWTVPAATSAQVTFTSPDRDEYVVHTTPDGHGARQAQIVLDRPGTWSAVVSNGDEHTALAK